MTSVLNQTFRHKLYLKEQYRKEIEQYCRREIGYRTYYMSQYCGGKQWRMLNQGRIAPQDKVVLELNDDGHATILALKYSG